MLSSRVSSRRSRHGLKIDLFQCFVCLFTGAFALVCLYPFLLVISGSLTSKEAAILYGFRLIPRSFTTAAYETLFVNARAIINGYKVTVFVTVDGTIMSLCVNAMMGFVLSRKQLPLRHQLLCALHHAV